MGLLADTPTLYRAMPVADLELSGDGRTLEVLLVPWDQTTRVVELVNGDLLDYNEGFHRGAFDRQITAGQSNAGHFGRITFFDQHPDKATGDRGYGKLGRLRHMADTDAGLTGRIRVDTDNVQKVKDARDEGINELSIEFHPLASTGDERQRGSEVWRTDAFLTGVALDPMGAYQGAEILAMRADADLLAEQSANADVIADLDKWLDTERDRWADLG